MSRISSLRYDELDEQGQAVWDSVVGTRGSALVNAEGCLMGPFDAWVQAPVVGGPAASLGAAIRFGSSIDRRLSELAIITVAARWKAEFEWWAHSRLALEHSIDVKIVEAVGDGREPKLIDDKDRVVYDMASQLAEEGTIGIETFNTALDVLGLTATIELVTLCGYYTLVSFVLNAFGVPLPPGEAPKWS